MQNLAMNNCLIKKMNLVICGKEEGYKMIRFEFRNIGEYLGTRQLGEQVRKQLLPLIKGDERVELDFTGVDVVSNSFADECLAKLMLEMSIEELKQRTTFTGLNDFAKKNIVVAFRRRAEAMTKTA